MKKRKKWWPKGVWGALLIAILTIGIIVSIIAIEAQNENGDLPKLWQSVMLSILCSIAASIIFIIVQNFFTNQENKELEEKLDDIEKKLKRQNELYDSGIVSIHRKAYFDKEEEFWKQIINNTENRLDLIGRSLSKWFKREYRDLFVEKIVKMLESEKTVRLLLSTEQFNFKRVKQAYMKNITKNSLNKAEKTVLYLLQELEKVEDAKKEYLHIYITNLQNVTYLYIRTDYQCIISPYILSPSNHQHSFLLELQSDSAYTKAFENDFDEMIEGMECLDLSQKNRIAEVGMELVQWITVDNAYSGSNWNFEKTNKYVYKMEDMLFEVGYFEHYCDDKFIKSVIELPISFGCPSKCKFCASSTIQNFYKLNADQMMWLFERIYMERRLYEKDYVLLTMTGTGDLYFNDENLREFLVRLTAYKNLAITVSSCLWNPWLLKQYDCLSEHLSVRNIQITYISSEKNIVETYIPFYKNKDFEFEEMIEYIKSSEKHHYRINYIMIKGVNDSSKDFEKFKEMLIGVKDKIVVRISKLNETNATRQHMLCSGDMQSMEELNGILQNAGIDSYLFYSKENDNMNCGQLITEDCHEA